MSPGLPLGPGVPSRPPKAFHCFPLATCHLPLGGPRRRSGTTENALAGYLPAPSRRLGPVIHEGLPRGGGGAASRAAEGLEECLALDKLDVVAEELLGEEAVAVALYVAGQRLQLVVELHHDVDELHAVVVDSELAPHHVGRHAEHWRVGAEAHQRLLGATAMAHVHVLDATLCDARPLLEPAPAALGVRPMVVRVAIVGDGRRDDHEEAREGGVDRQGLDRHELRRLITLRDGGVVDPG
eukprot:scaffold61806_cov67-Phaeocystis_antarctica.AAC.1